VASRCLSGLAAATSLLRDAGLVTHMDADDLVKEVYGYAGQGTGRRSV
jgi:hypothetical protein